MNADFFWWFIGCHDDGKRKMTHSVVCVCVCVCVCACVRCVNSIPSESSWWLSTPSLSAKPHTVTWVPQDDRRLSWPFSSSWYYRPKKTCALGRWWAHWNVDIARRAWSLFKWRKPAHCFHCLSSSRELRGLKSFLGAKYLYYCC